MRTTNPSISGNCVKIKSIRTFRYLMLKGLLTSPKVAPSPYFSTSFFGNKTMSLIANTLSPCFLQF